MEKRGEKGKEAFRTISEVATELDLPQHVLRFWESKFTHIKPMKRGGNRRYYRPDDVEILRVIRKLLHSDGFTIRGVQKLFRQNGLRQTIDSVMGVANSTYGETEDRKDIVMSDVLMPASLIERESKVQHVAESSDKVMVNKADLHALITELKELRAQFS
jgi:DNA-binding transcriptional MerR regulator